MTKTLSDTPFLDISAPLMRKCPRAHHTEGEPELHGGTDTGVPAPLASRHASTFEAHPKKAPEGSPFSRAEMVFEAAVKAVQASLKHLSEESIRFPPRNMPDATVASQIALHVVMHRRAATGWLQQRTLHKSVSVYGRARDVIDGRLSEPEFAAVYSKIAADAEDILAAMDAKFEGHDD